MAGFNDALKKRLPPELYAQVSDALGDDFNYDLVPRSRLNAVISQRNKLQEQLGLSSTVQDEFTTPSPLGMQVPDTLLAQLSQGSHQTAGTPNSAVTQLPVNNSAAGTDTQGAGKTIAELEASHKAALREVSLRYEVLNKLREAGALDPELIYNAKLLDLTQVKDAEGGGFSGLDEVVKTLTDNKERAYLFGASQSKVPAGTGRSGADEKNAELQSLESSIDKIFSTVTPGVAIPAAGAATQAPGGITT